MSALSEAIEQLHSNDRQWEAFQAQGHCAVLAPPGSGKTKLLTTKLAHALVRDIVKAPRGVACITMTNETALELRRRLRALGVRRRPNLFIGTVHAFALSRIVAPFAAAAGRDDLAASHLASDGESQEAFDAAFDAVGFRSPDRAEVRATTAKARQRLDLSGNRMLGGEPIAAMALRLQDELARRHVYDFHDLVRHAVELVEDYDWVGRVLAATFPRVYVDEYQDLAPGLDRIVRGVTLRADVDSTLFAVGDPDQAIYAFSGAHPDLLRKLAADPDVSAISLDRNYRCAQGIIDVSLRALGEDRQIAGERAGGSVTVHAVTGGEVAQSQMALELVQAATKGGTAYEQIAVIAPWGSDRDRCADALREAGVPVFARSDEHWRTTSLTMLLEAMASWASRRDAAGVDLPELLETFSALVRGARERAALRSVTRALLDGEPEAPAADFIEAIAQAALATYAADPTASEDARELSRMRRALAVGGDASSMTLAQLGDRARAPGHVMAATIHGAKGLEFDVVIIAGADEGGLPGFSPSAEDIAEGRRKFYVSITRAREQVHLIYTDSRISRKGRPYAVRPSPFIGELGV
ncbi:MAG: ATP-dependent helicase UvrD/PcrA [Microbacteriaceae bacterium]|nr:ATP-dependent helicase UvrD/PcrA [Microbacteriaceae bacterium]